MRAILIATALLIAFATQGAAVSVSGSMSCKVKAQHVLIVEGGEIDTFSGYPGGIKVGDTVDFKYKFSGLDGFQVELTTLSGKPVSFVTKNYVNVKRDYFFESGPIPASKINTAGAFVKGTLEEVYATNDYFNFENPFFEGTFERYFKNDWSGILLNQRGLVLHVLALDCRHNNDKLDRFIDAMLQSNKD